MKYCEYVPRGLCNKKLQMYGFHYSVVNLSVYKLVKVTGNRNNVSLLKNIPIYYEF